MAFKAPADSSHYENGNIDGPPMKRIKHEANGNCSLLRAEDIMAEVSRFSKILSPCIDSLTDGERSN